MHHNYYYYYYYYYYSLKITNIMPLSKVLSNKIQAHFTANVATKYWDYNDEFTKEQIIKLLDGDRDSIWDDFSDGDGDLEWEHAKEIIGKFTTEICAELEIEEEDFDFDDFWGEERENFDVSIDDNLEQLARNTSNLRVRIRLETTWNSLAPCYYMRNKIEMDSYFGELVTALKICPQTAKKYFIGKGWTATGKFPSKPKWTPLVSVEDLFDEIANNNGYASLTFYGRVSMMDVLNLDERPFKAVIAKGERCGLFASGSGCGSTLEMTLLKNVTLDLDTKYTIKLDSDETTDYGIDNTYGLSSEGWGKKLIVLN